MFPGYKFKGKRYATVRGLTAALFADSGCGEISCVDSNRQIKAFNAAREVVAVYSVGAPCADSLAPMLVTRVN